MGIWIGADGGTSDNFDEQIEKLEALVADLKRVRGGWRPGPEDLKDAPLLEYWDLVKRSVPCLEGQTTDHPILGGTTVRTSELWALAPQAGWARTYSRFYRIGGRRPQRKPD